MSLTPAADDPNFANEYLRRISDPQSFGIGGLSDQQKAAAQARVAELNKQQHNKK